MAGTRTTITPSSREVGALTTFRVNTFALAAIKESVSGSQIIKILMRALRPARDQAMAEWPRLTGASGDTIRILPSEISETNARAALVIGGPPLIEDPRNRSGKDYSPYVEFNGTSKTAPGTLTRAMYENAEQMKEIIADGIRRELRRATRG